MPVEHFPRSPLDSENGEIVNQTRNISIPPFLPNERAHSHYRALLSVPHSRPGNSVKGRRFETCVIDALVAAGVNPNRMEFNKDVSNGKDVEVDIIVHPSKKGGVTYFLMLKTSLRERWQQADRTAMMLNMLYKKGEFKTALIVFRERPETPDNEIEKEAVALRRNFKKSSITEGIFHAKSQKFADLVCEMVAS